MRCFYGTNIGYLYPIVIYLWDEKLHMFSITLSVPMFYSKPRISAQSVQ